ncbi:MAG: hypothetical protein JWN03_2453 [Nocardia sp.]|uniref:DUF1800 family protein n=1 Tax=Nocardia sp. TaxID=1821 RepID=UPI002633389E|nr:DUF1800 family protein [Nocardia sp.]MCU1642178.1 hypothetical protein [Nocardia sp.]
MDELAGAAHVLRRTTFGPFPGMPERLAGRGIDGVIDAALSAAPLDPGTPVFDEDAEVGPGGPAAHWLKLMADPAAGVHEKLVWFWHGHFTSSHDKVETWDLMWRQHLLFRRYALGNFRELAHAVTVDGAMLQWLDGAGSQASAPNENHGRELMELFTLGRGNYGQADVKAAAVAMSGWTVDDKGAVLYDRDSGNQQGVQLLGRSVTNAHDVVDALCDRPECARLVAGKLHHYLVGEWAPEQRLGELAEVFSKAHLEIRPLVQAILGHPSFMAAVRTRPRYPVEWVTAALAVCGIDDAALAFDTMRQLGQAPFYPPNVAGWPPGMRWLAPGEAVARAALAVEARAIAEIAGAADPVAAVLARAGIYDATPATVTAARDLAFALRRDSQPAAAALLALMLTAPEFTLA